MMTRAVPASLALHALAMVALLLWGDRVSTQEVRTPRVIAVRLVEAPRKAIVVLITDFYEGGDPARLVASVRTLCQQGTTVLGLAALDEEASPTYDRELAGRLADEGAHVGAMTPDQLAGFLAEVMSR